MNWKSSLGNNFCDHTPKYFHEISTYSRYLTAARHQCSLENLWFVFCYKITKHMMPSDITPQAESQWDNKPSLKCDPQIKEAITALEDANNTQWWGRAGLRDPTRLPVVYRRTKWLTAASAPWVKNKIKIRMDLSAQCFFPSYAGVTSLMMRWADFHLETAFENKLRQQQVCLMGA